MVFPAGLSTRSDAPANAVGAWPHAARVRDDRPVRLRYENRLLLLALATGLPGVALALTLLWTGPFTRTWQAVVSVLLVSAWAAIAWILRARVAYTFRTVANLLETLRREDFSIRARRDDAGDVLDTVWRELNELADTLKTQRLSALEAGALLRRVMASIDVAVFAFDPAGRLRLVNRAGELLLAQPARRLLGRTADELGLGDALAGPVNQTYDRPFPGGWGTWGVRRSTFREGGLPHHLLVVADLSHALREEERKAWQRLVRVLGHEVNNSLAPIKSMAATLHKILGRDPPPADRDDDLARGLAVIEQRAAGLSRFLSGYSRLAQLPPPRLERVRLADLCARVAALEMRTPVVVAAGPDVAVEADPGQLEQVLINLVRNAADAAIETGGGVRLGWEEKGDAVELWVEDEGPGLPDSANLFVPFFTTKQGGTGIGLALSRQIAEAHRGSLHLEGRTDRQGCRARLRLPARVIDEA
jgi:nitrogen fixation/metabolism regulation signal transduction histidine kinase